MANGTYCVRCIRGYCIGNVTGGGGSSSPTTHVSSRLGKREKLTILGGLRGRKLLSRSFCPVKLSGSRSTILTCRVSVALNVGRV